jgi:hypothetical protein
VNALAAPLFLLWVLAVVAALHVLEASPHERPTVLA